MAVNDGNGGAGGVPGGLAVLMASALALVLAVWVFAFFLGDSLAQVHMRHKAAGVAGQAAAILRESGEGLPGRLRPQTRAELRRLMKYREVARMDIADGAGRVVWSSAPEVSAGRIAAEGRALTLRIRKTTGEGYARTFARATVRSGEGRVISMEMDVTGLLAWYRRISFLAAKTVTTVLLGGFLVMGMILFGRYRERRHAEDRLQALRRRNAEEQEKVRVLEERLERLNADMARLNRRLAAAMRKRAGAGSGGRKSRRKTG